MCPFCQVFEKKRKETEEMKGGRGEKKKKKKKKKKEKNNNLVLETCALTMWPCFLVAVVGFFSNSLCYQECHSGIYLFINFFIIVNNLARHPRIISVKFHHHSFSCLDAY